MLDYWVRLYRLYGIPIIQIVVVLLPPPAETIIENRFQIRSTSHEFTVVKMWEQDTELFLNDPVLLPFAALTQVEKSDALLQQISERIDRIESVEEKRQVSSYVQLIAGLKYDKNIVKRYFPRGHHARIRNLSRNLSRR
jgi:predicted transposase YdaD